MLLMLLTTKQCVFTDYSEFLFLSLFTLEMLLKMYALGLATYWSSSFNKFDFIVSTLITGSFRKETFGQVR